MISFISCTYNLSEIKSVENKIGELNAIRLKNFVNSDNLFELSPENSGKIYENKQAKFYLFDLDSIPENQSWTKILPEYQTNFDPQTRIGYLSLINRYYNTKQLQNLKKTKLKQNINSIYVPNVGKNSLNFWYLYMMPISIGFSEIKINGKSFSIPPTIPKKLSPYSSIEMKLLKKNSIFNDNKNYIQINVNQMINSFALKVPNPDCIGCEKVVFGLLDSEKYPNFKLNFESLDFKNKIIRFKIDKKFDNFDVEKSETNSLNSNISTLNFLLKTKNYQQDLNPDNYFEKNTEKISENIDFPFVRFFTKTFVVPFEGSNQDFDAHFKVEISNLNDDFKN
ncbi:hypothetical protein IM807_00210 [Mycoplasma sp. 'Moose RK']|nr:hypothetical protein [Mycoplasma sp. 'Moose RK']